ncbi:hypothetical protein HY970_04045 [Candidatus Kaiserbacteria bacterium]|nr:hypothetical protein [Candidatus Kaiserbacteria bacterium]
MTDEVSGYDFSDIAFLNPESRDSWPMTTYPTMGLHVRATEDALKSSNLGPDSYFEKTARHWLAQMKDKSAAEIKRICKSFVKDPKSGVFQLARHLIDIHGVRTVRGKNREIYVYESGVYVPGEDILKKAIREILGETCTTYYVKETLETIKDRTCIDRATFTVDPNLINLNNGIFNVQTGRLHQHDACQYFQTKIPVNYDVDADCPIIKQYLADVIDEEQLALVQEWFGYALYREYFIKKAMILVGDGDTGKSTYISLLVAFIGEGNVAGISLQKLSYDKFAAAGLYQKHINIYDDLSDKDIQDNGAFKIATGGGYISGEKKFMDQFIFKNFAKLVFACNKIPDVKDATDHAYFSRWVIVPFNRVIEEHKKDKQLIHKMTTPQELSGLLNFALIGLRRVLEKQGFSYEKETHEIKTQMMRSASTIAGFSEDCLEESSGEWIAKEKMYEAYCDYASSNKLPAASSKTFGGRIRMHAPYISEFKPRDPTDPKGKKQVTAWRNVRLKAQLPEEPESQEELFEKSTDSIDIL